MASRQPRPGKRNAAEHIIASRQPRPGKRNAAEHASGRGPRRGWRGLVSARRGPAGYSPPPPPCAGPAGRAYQMRQLRGVPPGGETRKGRLGMGDSERETRKGRLGRGDSERETRKGRLGKGDSEERETRKGRLGKSVAPPPHSLGAAALLRRRRPRRRTGQVADGRSGSRAACRRGGRGPERHPPPAVFGRAEPSVAGVTGRGGWSAGPDQGAGGGPRRQYTLRG